MEIRKNIQQKSSCVITSIILIVLVFFGIKYITGDYYQVVISQFLGTSIYLVISLILLEMTFLLIDAETITLFVKRYNSSYKYRQGLKVLLYGNFYKGITFGNGTTVAQIYLLNKQGIPPGASSSMLMMQYVFHRLGILINATVLIIVANPLGLFEYYKYDVFLMIAYGVNLVSIVGLILICTCKPFHRFLLRIIIKGLTWFKQVNRIVGIRHYFEDIEKESSILFQDNRWVYKVVALNCIKLLFVYSMPYMIYKDLIGYAPPMSLIQGMALTALMLLLVGVIPTPVGMGSTEVVYFILFNKVFGPLTVSTSMLIYRGITYYFPFIISLFFMARYKLNKKYYNK